MFKINNNIIVNTIKTKSKLFGQSLARVTPACLMMMVQGNILAISIGHWKTAIETAMVVGFLLVALSFSSKTLQIRENKYSMAGLVALVTMAADFNVHREGFSGEALMTGVATGLLWLLVSFTPLGEVGKAIKKYKNKS